MRESKPDWFQKHELDDSERHGKLMAGIAGIEGAVKSIEGRLNGTEGSLPPVSGKAKGGLVALVAAIAALSNVITQLLQAVGHH